MALFFLGWMPTYGQNNNSPFYEGTYANLRKEAKAQNLPYVLYFYVEGSNAHQQMKLMTFTPEFLARIDGRYLKPLPVPAFSIYGDYIIKKYQVNSYPQLLVFTAGDKLLERIEGVIPEADLLKKLEKHRTKSGTADSIDVFRENLDPNLVDKLQNDSKTLGIYKVSAEDVNADSGTPVGIQLGVFSTIEHAVRAVYDLGLGDHDNVLISLHKTETEGKTFARLTLGPFPTLAEGKNYETKLRTEKGLYGFLIDMKDFRPLEPLSEGNEESPFTPFEETLNEGN